MKKKFLSLFTAALMAASLLVVMPAASAGAETSGDYEYKVLDDGTIKITDYTGSDAELTIPSEIDGKSVTRIGYGAFYNCTSLESVTIPDSVTSIGGYAFSDTPFLNNQTTTVKYAGKFAIDCDEDAITAEIKGGTKAIADYAFYYCTSLESVTIPDSVTSIGAYAFCWCEDLAGVTIPDSVTSIGVQAFGGCSSLASVTIPDSVTEIGGYAFYDCTSLASVTIPNSVTSIGKWAFYNCTSLESVTIPDSVTSIGDCAFGNCTSLESIIVDAENTKYSSVDGVLYNKDITELLACPGAKAGVTIPDGVTSIGDYAFNYCTSLESITIPDSVTEIGYYAFEGCTSLESVTIPDGVTSIGDGAFWYCTSLASVTIPKSVTNIGEYAFGYGEYDYETWEYIKIDGFTIYCYSGTAGEQYAIDNGFNYVLLSSDSKPGDVNGDGLLDIKDMSLVYKHINETKLLTDEQVKIADVNADGDVDIKDYSKIYKHVNETAPLW